MDRVSEAEILDDMCLNVWVYWDDTTSLLVGRVVALQSPQHRFWVSMISISYVSQGLSAERLHKKLGPRAISVFEKITLTSMDGDGERGSKI